MMAIIVCSCGKIYTGTRSSVTMKRHLLKNPEHFEETRKTWSKEEDIEWVIRVFNGELDD